MSRREDCKYEDLIRMSTEIRGVTRSDGMMTLFGVPILFDEWTTIQGWEGHFKERIAAGAVDKTLEERGDKIKVLFNHGMDPQIGEKPLGRATIQVAKEDGLHVEVPLADTSYNRDIQALLEAKALDGMSFRFAVISDEWDNLDADDDSLPERTITELRLYEYGPVTFPAYEATTAGVRSLSEFAEYRQRQTALHTALEVPESDPAPSRSADEDPAQSQSVSKQTISRLIRKIDLTIKGVTL